MLNIYKFYDDAISLPLYNELNNKLQILNRLSQYIDGTSDIDDAEEAEQEFAYNKLSPVISIIAKSPKLAAFYATYILKERWPEAEHVIAKNAEGALEYAMQILSARFLEAETYIKRLPSAAKQYAVSILAKDPKWPHPRGRWPDAEPFIMKDPYFACRYAADVIGDRWPEAEPYIMKSPFAAVTYAESILAKDPNWLYTGWPEAEQYIKNNEAVWNKYKQHFDIE